MIFCTARARISKLSYKGKIEWSEVESGIEVAYLEDTLTDGVSNVGFFLLVVAVHYFECRGPCIEADCNVGAFFEGFTIAEYISLCFHFLDILFAAQVFCFLTLRHHEDSSSLNAFEDTDGEVLWQSAAYLFEHASILQIVLQQEPVNLFLNHATAAIANF